jgi:hypothetical protein
MRRRAVTRAFSTRWKRWSGKSVADSEHWFAKIATTTANHYAQCCDIKSTNLVNSGELWPGPTVIDNELTRAP